MLALIKTRHRAVRYGETVLNQYAALCIPVEILARERSLTVRADYIFHPDLVKQQIFQIRGCGFVHRLYIVSVRPGKQQIGCTGVYGMTVRREQRTLLNRNVLHPADSVQPSERRDVEPIGAAVVDTEAFKRCCSADLETEQRHLRSVIVVYAGHRAAEERNRGRLNISANRFE